MELHELADNFLNPQRKHVLEALKNDPDIFDELADFILTNAETAAYRQNQAFSQLLSLFRNENARRH